MKKMSEVDLSKNLYTLFVMIGMIGFTLMMLITQDVRVINFDISKSIPIIRYTIRLWGTVGKTPFIILGMAMSIYSFYLLYATNKLVHSVIMTGLIMTLIGGIFIFTCNNAIVGSTPGAFLVVLFFTGVFSLGNVLLYS